VKSEAGLTRCVLKVVQNLLVLTKVIWSTAADGIGIVAIGKAIPIHLGAPSGLRQRSAKNVELVSSWGSQDGRAPVSLRRKPLTTYSRAAKMAE
jgi:hypothetical protein